jgi:hypothetical protein
LQQRGAQVGAWRQIDAHGLAFTPEAVNQLPTVKVRSMMCASDLSP